MKRKEDAYMNKFGLWWPLIRPFWESGELDNITDEIIARAKKGAKVLPDSSLVYRAFQETPPDSVKVFIFGLCPYHTAVKVADELTTVADGLALSCSRTEICAPSLEQFYNAIEEEYKDGLCLKCFRNPDLSYLAKQGVFLGNISLTTEYQMANRHGDIWEPFTTYFMDKVVGFKMTKVPVIYLGKEAEKYYGYLAPFQWYFALPHPASASYSGETWNSDGTFKKVNQIIRGNKQKEIEWMIES